MSAGSHTLTALYAGEDLYLPSTSPAGSVSALKGSTAIALATSSPNVPKLPTICVMTLSALLVTLFAASAFHSYTEASAEFSEIPHPLLRLAQNGNVRLQRVNVFSSDGKDPRQQLDRGSENARPFLPAGLAINNREIVETDQKALPNRMPSWFLPVMRLLITTVSSAIR
jgi:hypothetical protein